MPEAACGRARGATSPPPCLAVVHTLAHALRTTLASRPAPLLPRHHPDPPAFPAPSAAAARPQPRDWTPSPCTERHWHGGLASADRTKCQFFDKVHNYGTAHARPMVEHTLARSRAQPHSEPTAGVCRRCEAEPAQGHIPSASLFGSGIVTGLEHHVGQPLAPQSASEPWNASFLRW